MGHILNPGNDAFRKIRNDEYIDHSMLIEQVNHVLFTTDSQICLCKPHGFGKTYDAGMLCAYYDRSCHSESLFNDLKIASEADYRKYLNHFDVIYLNMNEFSDSSGNNCIVQNITERIMEELKETYPEIPQRESLLDILLSVVEITGQPFVFIIDEWDVIFRKDKNDQKQQKEYILFLRSLFKNSAVTDRIAAAVYMTGILPIRKYGTQSSLSDFSEYTMVKPRRFAPYVGFTEEEVRKVCRETNMDFEKMKKWYKGYFFHNTGYIYNPYSVMKAVSNRKCDLYWNFSETYESLKNSFDIDPENMQKDIVRMLGGDNVPVSTTAFQNDLISIKDKNDFLTLMIHLGYLAYGGSETVRIPDQEAGIQFKTILRKTGSEYSDRHV